jgi:uncharacterized protein YjbJ (UPF0337 family)
MSDKENDALRDGMGLDHKTSGDEVEGRVERVLGETKQEIGRETGNQNLETDGAVERAEGVAKETLAESSHEINNAIEDVGDTVSR